MIIRLCLECFGDVLGMFCDVLGMFQGCFRGVLGMFQGCLRDALGMFITVIHHGGGAPRPPAYHQDSTPPATDAATGGSRGVRGGNAPHPSLLHITKIQHPWQRLLKSEVSGMGFSPPGGNGPPLQGSPQKFGRKIIMNLVK